MTQLTNEQAIPSRSKKAAVGLLWLKREARKLQLSQDDVARLLGELPLRTLAARWAAAEKTGNVNLTRDQYDRLSLIVGIYGNIKTVAPNGDLGMFNRVYNDYPLYGKSMKDFLLDSGSMEAMLTVRRWLDGLRG